jgi:predicted MFS family arabinose efflux permease
MFFLNGLLNASWVSRIPAIQTHLALSPNFLGLALVLQGVGNAVALPLIGRVSNLFGTRAVTLSMLAACCLGLYLIPLAGNFVLLALALGYFGFASSAMDVAMNAQGVAVQKLGQDSIMSRLHGLWSVGGMIGAAIGSFMEKNEMDPLRHFFIMAVLALVCGLLMRPFLLTKSEEDVQSGTAHSQSNGSAGGGRSLPAISIQVLWIICMISLLGFLCEGAIADWSTLYVEHSLQTTASFAALGYAAYSAAMAVGRFAGDFIIKRLGEYESLLYGGLLTSCAMTLTLLIAKPWAGIVALAIAGLGVCVLVPLLFNAVSRISGMSAAAAIARVALAGAVGSLIGPPILGFAAQRFGYSATMVGILLSQIGIVILTLLVGPSKRVEAEQTPAASDSYSRH